MPYKDLEKAREASRKHYRANREKVLERCRAWRKANPAKVRAYSKEHRERNPEKQREAVMRWQAKNPDYPREWRAKNPDKVKASRKRGRSHKAVTDAKWRAANPEKVREYNKRWREKHPEKKLDKGHRYRARLRGAAVIEKVDRLTIYKRDGGRCHLCGRFVSKVRFTLDHLVPLALGGVHTAANVKVAHLACNSRKGARFISY